MTGHRFEVGKQYENRKGVFTVLAINASQMRIRWDNGEEANTDAEDQEKIIQNMERELAASNERAGRRSAPAWLGSLFAGLREEDFKEDVTGTHWRSREQLGGAVCRLLETEHAFNSWAIYNRPEIHWASISRYGLHRPVFQAKFYILLTEDDARHGLYIERSDKTENPRDDWRALIRWLTSAGNTAWLHHTLLENGIYIFDPWPEQKTAFGGHIAAVPTGWHISTPSENKVFSVTTLPKILDALPSDKWLNLVIGTETPRATLLTLGASAASMIAKTFNFLMPVYENRVRVNSNSET